jgi:hypothetical protein
MTSADAGQRLVTERQTEADLATLKDLMEAGCSDDQEAA